MDKFAIHEDERIPEGHMLIGDDAIMQDVATLLDDPSDHDAFKRVVRAAHERKILSVRVHVVDEQ